MYYSEQQNHPMYAFDDPLILCVFACLQFLVDCALVYVYAESSLIFLFVLVCFHSDIHFGPSFVYWFFLLILFFFFFFADHHLSDAFVFTLYASHCLLCHLFVLGFEVCLLIRKNLPLTINRNSWTLNMITEIFH